METDGSPVESLHTSRLRPSAFNPKRADERFWGEGKTRHERDHRHTETARRLQMTLWNKPYTCSICRYVRMRLSNTASSLQSRKDSFSEEDTCTPRKLHLTVPSKHTQTHLEETKRFSVCESHVRMRNEQRYNACHLNRIQSRKGKAPLPATLPSPSARISP